MPSKGGGHPHRSGSRPWEVVTSCFFQPSDIEQPRKSVTRSVSSRSSPGTFHPAISFLFLPVASHPPALGRRSPVCYQVRPGPRRGRATVSSGDAQRDEDGCCSRNVFSCDNFKEYQQRGGGGSWGSCSGCRVHTSLPRWGEGQGWTRRRFEDCSGALVECMHQRVSGFERMRCS